MQTDIKNILRASYRSKRQTVGCQSPEYAEKLATVFLREIQIEKRSIIASYRAFKNEIDPAALEAALLSQGHSIALPSISENRDNMIFRLCNPGDELNKTPMGFMEPTTDATPVTPDIVLVPLLAFDSELNRLGYGGGFYDKALRHLRETGNVLAIGIAHSCQQTDTISTEPHDEKMDIIVTESGIIESAKT